MSDKADQDAIWILIFVLLALLAVVGYQMVVDEPVKEGSFFDFLAEDHFYVL